jgi:hypothetical protein
MIRIPVVDGGCADWRRRKEPCKHIFAALIWAVKARRALVLAEQRRAA